jgi:hypothetical protein
MNKYFKQHDKTMIVEKFQVAFFSEQNRIKYINAYNNNNFIE